MEQNWIDIALSVNAANAEAAEWLIGESTAYGIYIEDYSRLEEETLEIVQGNPVSLRGIKTVHEQRIERIYKEKQEYDEDQDLHPEPEILVERLALLAFQHESTSLDSFS